MIKESVILKDKLLKSLQNYLISYVTLRGICSSWRLLIRWSSGDGVKALEALLGLSSILPGDAISVLSQSLRKKLCYK